MSSESDAADAAPASRRGTPGSLTASLRAAPATPLRAPPPFAKITEIPSHLEETTGAETGAEAASGEAPSDALDQADHPSATGDPVSTGDATSSAAQVLNPSVSTHDDDSLAALLEANARLRSELDTTTAALADAVSSKFAAERALDVASRTHTHYGRMASGRTVTVTKEVADDLRVAIELQNEKLRKVNVAHELTTKTLADTRRAFGAESHALRSALDAAIAEQAELKLQCDVLRVKRLDRDEDDDRNRDKNILPPKEQQAVEAARLETKTARETADVAVADCENAKADLEAYKSESNQAAKDLANTHLQEMNLARTKFEKEIDSLKSALQDAEESSNQDRLQFAKLKDSGLERDELLAETLLKMETLESDLDRATRALKRRGTLVPTDEQMNAMKEIETNESGKTSQRQPIDEHYLERIAGLEAKLRRLAKEDYLKIGMHERAVATIRHEHVSVTKRRDLQIHQLFTEIERITVLYHVVKRRSDAFENALQESDPSVSVSLAAALDAKEQIRASLSVNELESKVVFETNRDPRPAGKTVRGKTSTAASPQKNRTHARRSLAPESKYDVSPSKSPLKSINAPEKPKTTSENKITVQVEEEEDSKLDFACLPKLPQLPAELAEHVTKRVKALEKIVENRENHWRRVLREVQDVNEEVLQNEKRACVAAVETKNAQIKKFKAKLNVVIAAAHEKRLLESSQEFKTYA